MNSIKQNLSAHNLNWSIVEKPVHTDVGRIDGHKALVRSDNNIVLGIAKDSYRAVQPEQLAEIGDIVQSFGASITKSLVFRDGRRIFLQFDGGDISIATDTDVIKTSLVLANGNDGSLALSFFGTSLRLSCENSCNIALGSARASGAAISLRHTAKIQTRLPEIERIIAAFAFGRDRFVERNKALAAKKITDGERNEFFLDVYTRVLGLAIPPKDADSRGAARARTNAVERIAQWQTNYKRELEERGIQPSLWAAANAITEEFADREDGEEGSVLIGSKAQRRLDVFDAALALV